MNEEAVQKRARLKEKMNKEMVTLLAAASEILDTTKAVNVPSEKRTKSLSRLCQTIISCVEQYVEVFEEFSGKGEAGKDEQEQKMTEALS